MSRGPVAAARLLALLICLSYGRGLYVKVYNRNDRSGVLSYPNSLVRQKREWTVPPAFIREEEDNSHKNPIARIHSDLEDTGIVVTYTISGQGVTEPPYGLFVINGKTGDLNITGRVDREKTPILLVRGHALDKNGAKLEEPIDLPIKVVDINDNFPVFSHEVFVGSIEELSETNTVVMRINATDADEPNNLNSKIAFKIVSQNPSNAFSMDKNTGEVRVAKINLDRETQSSYSLVVEAKDRGDEIGGNTATCSLEIKILDVNDNLPVLESRTFEGSIEENRANVEIMRIKVFDRDEEFSDNWLAKFTFVSGNEGGFFQIVTDTQTNEGILTVVKELDYEKMQSLNLGIVVTNKAEFHKSIKPSYKAETIPIKIKVINVQEGPVFPGGTKIIEASEKLQIKQVIGQYQAYDEDTGKIAERIIYMKGKDAANWVTVDSVTGEIRLAKKLDYESHYVVNGTYTITMLGVTTDSPRKTITGTVVIQVKDENDNCPVIVNPVQTVCSDAKLVDVTARDLDGYPNSYPFSFTVIDEPEGTAEKWIIASGNVVPLLLLLCPGGLGAKGFGGAKTFADIPDHSEAMLRQWNSEGAAPEEKALLSFIPPTTLGSLKGGTTAAAAGAAAAGMSGEETLMGAGSSASHVAEHHSTITRERWEEQRRLLSAVDYGAMAAGAAGTAGGMAGVDGKAVVSGGGVAVGAAGAMNEEFLRDYFNDKAVSFADEDEEQAAKDCLLVYSQGESGSPHGSVGCCSFIEGDLDDRFLDDLGDKFKTLAEICIGRQINMKDGGYKNESDPQFKENVVVTERVLAPASSLQGMVKIPDLPHGSNVMVTERMVKSAGAGPGALTVQDLPDSQYVVVRERERVLVPAAEQGSLSFPTSTEERSTVLTASGLQSRAEQATDTSSGRQEHAVITDSPLNLMGSDLRGPPSASATLSKSSRVTKYSTVQYTRS
ncbi:hypothetical protein DUI87_07653 [Hirundo rustica rustica]|uniref:Cadherin domain-containing protein n=1 Tax=Hirundo rustica rustica TaxID=333673 RepID=A0A3M0KS16_HIRRU|nr:hypothetical protein DUI87_07653 [Hirundo rustica rustica]